MATCESQKVHIWRNHTLEELGFLNTILPKLILGKLSTSFCCCSFFFCAAARWYKKGLCNFAAFWTYIAHKSICVGSASSFKGLWRPTKLWFQGTVHADLTNHKLLPLYRLKYKQTCRKLWLECNRLYCSFDRGYLGKELCFPLIFYGKQSWLLFRWKRAVVQRMHPATCQNDKQLITDRIFDMSTNITVLHTRNLIIASKHSDGR